MLLLFYSTLKHLEVFWALRKMWPFRCIMGQISFKSSCRNVGHLASRAGWAQVEAAGLCAAFGYSTSLQRGNQHTPEQTPRA